MWWNVLTSWRSRERRGVVVICEGGSIIWTAAGDVRWPARPSTIRISMVSSGSLSSHISNRSSLLGSGHTAAVNKSQVWLEVKTIMGMTALQIFPNITESLLFRHHQNCRLIFRLHFDNILGAGVLGNPSMSELRSLFTSKSMQHIFANMSFESCKTEQIFSPRQAHNLHVPGAFHWLIQVQTATGQPGHLILPHLNFIFIAQWNWGFYMVCKSRYGFVCCAHLKKGKEQRSAVCTLKKLVRGHRALHKSSCIPF